ncbi:MAG: TetR/AcrR family transcriptional regulator [Acetobacteraceae bacterium]|nr:TetR/AcrR family transcriptional regulator [Acetobacteraceae bacterium]
MNVVQEENEHGSDGGRKETAAGRRQRALRDALLAAAERAIAEAGLPGLKAREVAREAGCALGAVYTAFADLDALVLAVNARTLDALEAHLLAASRPEADPVAQVAALAEAYLDYAGRHRPRWAALFEHRMAAGRDPPAWYAAKQAELFRHVEGAVAALRPGLEGAELAGLARAAFSAVHGVVSLGLDQKLSPMPEGMLRRELRLVAEAMARGLDART